MFRSRDAAVQIGLAVAVTLGLLGCGGAEKGAEAPPSATESAFGGEPPEAPSETITAPVTELRRSGVVATVDQGFGKFLQKVEVSASVNEGKFEGFRVVRFTSPAEWQGVGLLPGDVIKRVNGQAIERPEQAYAVFASLKTAPALEVQFVREGRPMQFSLPIVDDFPASPQSASLKAPPPPEPPVEETPVPPEKSNASEKASPKRSEAPRKNGGPARSP